jgi:DNA invertase Pin-like site-specific DNA recombinase
MKLVAYTRVSTDKQAEQGLGLDVQRAAITARAKARGDRVTLWTSDEGVSGSNGLDARVGLADALEALKSRACGALVVYRLDRLARDLVLQEQLLADVWRMGARVCSTSDSEDAYLDPAGAADDPSRALIRQILGAVGEYERAMIRLRLRSGKARKKAQGGFIGGQAPLGFRASDGALVADQSEQHTLARIVQLHTEGHSLRRICAVLDAEGVHAKRGGRFHPYTVKLVLERAAHAAVR